MDPPVVPLHRPKRKSFFSSAYATIVPQSHHPSPGKREVLRKAQGEPVGEYSTARQRSKSTARQPVKEPTLRKVSSVDTSFRMPVESNMNSTEPVQTPGATNEPLVEEAQYINPPDRSSYIAPDEHYPSQQPKSRSRDPKLDTPDFSGFDNATSAEPHHSSPSAPRRSGEYGRRAMHIPARTRYETTTFEEDIARHRPRSQQASSNAPNSATINVPASSLQPRSIPAPVLQPQADQLWKHDGQKSRVEENSAPTTPENAWDRGNRSSFESGISKETAATSVITLSALQTKGPDNSEAHALEPLMEDDPQNFDLIAPPQQESIVGLYALEKRADLMFGAKHLRTIFADPKLLLKFTSFLSSHKPGSIHILVYYLDALKALKAIQYANAIAEALEPLEPHQFTQSPAPPTKNQMLEAKAEKAFDVLVQECLPAYIAHVWVQVVSDSIQRRITGTMAPHLREASEGLAEVFCLTDPSRPDNPIVFASEEFAKTTQYGMGYTIGRNCRFLQGPKTDRNSVRRLAEACKESKETTQVFVNYRRDGSPFMNLLMIAPLMDSRGNTRYFIGAQVDVSGLVKDCAGLDALMQVVAEDEDPEGVEHDELKDEFQQLNEMFNGAEIESVRRHGGGMHHEQVEEDRRSSVSQRPRLLLKNSSYERVHIENKRDSHGSSVPSVVKERLNGRLEGVYQHYILIRPAPSLRILFTSPSLRVPGILQSPFLNRIGGSARVRNDLTAALSEGRGVTAKIRWLTRADENGEGEGRPRWIHCTPLIGHSGAVGVWMIVLVDEDDGKGLGAHSRRFKQAPPVSARIGDHEWEPAGARDSRNASIVSAHVAPRQGNLFKYDQLETAKRIDATGGLSSRRSSGTPANVPSSSSVKPGVAKGWPGADGRPIMPSDASEFSFNLR